MTITQLHELLERLKTGTFDVADPEALEHTSAKDILGHLEAVFVWLFQERRVREKWEIGMAKTIRRELASVYAPGFRVPLFLPVLNFRSCLFVSGEQDVVTGIALCSRLKVKPIPKVRGMALTTGTGFKLDHLPDGWLMKKIEKSTVRLSEQFLQKRGFQFDSFWFFPSKIA